MKVDLLWLRCYCSIIHYRMDNTYKGYSAENVSKCNEILESVRPRLGRFIKEKLYGWGLDESDILWLDEVGIGVSGIRIFVYAVLLFPLRLRRLDVKNTRVDCNLQVTAGQFFLNANLCCR